MNEKIIKENYISYMNVEYSRSVKPLLMDIISSVDCNELRPAVIYLHGGGWGNGSKDNYGGHVWNLAMADLGMVAVSIDYTLKREAIFPQQIIDVKEAIRFLRTNGKQYGIDGDKIAIWGHSSGAHLAMLAALSGDHSKWENETSSIVQACASVAGAIDLYEAIKDGDGAAARLFGKEIETIDEIKDLVELANPLHYVTSVMPPTMIVHGEDDLFVPIKHSQRLHDAIPESIFLKVKNADHFMINGDLSMMNIARQIAIFFHGVFFNNNINEIEINKDTYKKIKKKDDLDDDFFNQYSELFKYYT